MVVPKVIYINIAFINFQGDEMLENWLWFEKGCGIIQTKGEKSKPVVKVLTVWNLLLLFRIPTPQDIGSSREGAHAPLEKYFFREMRKFLKCFKKTF